MSRVLFASHACYLDDASGAAVASRAMIEALRRQGFETEVLCGGMMDLDHEVALDEWLQSRAFSLDESGGPTSDGPVLESPLKNTPGLLRLRHNGISVTIHPCPTSLAHEPKNAECISFLSRLDELLNHFRPQVVVGYGGDALSLEIFKRSQANGCVTIFHIHNFFYYKKFTFNNVDRVIAPSYFASTLYRNRLGLHCDVLPYLVDFSRVNAVGIKDSKYLTFVNPCFEKGVYFFARLAAELGKSRDDIPILVVESRGTETTLAGCGLDLRSHRNLHIMSHTSDPSRFWNLTRVCLLPSLWWENQPLAAVEALVNGIPVVGSDRGGIPETLGRAGIVLPLPDRLTPTTRILPTADEVVPWIEAIIRLWDDPEHYAEHRRRALAESRRWAPEILEPQYVRFFNDLGTA